MEITKKQENYIKKYAAKRGVEKIAKALNLSPEEILNHLQKGTKKQQELAQKTKKEVFQKKKASLWSWIKQKKYYLLILVILVTISYANSLNNEFLSDDIAGILENPIVDQIQWIFSKPFGFVRPLLYYPLIKVFGRIPAPLRTVSILFHLGSAILIFALVESLYKKTPAIIAASIFAVHPLLTEAVSWVSGGYYVYSAFFCLASLLAYHLASKNEDNNLYYLSLTFYFLGLESSEKVISFAGIILFFELIFGNLKKNWPKVLPFFFLSGIWIYKLLSGGSVSQRIEGLQMHHYQKPQKINPFFQIPFAITSYLELFLWPRALTLYHTETMISPTEFYIRLGFFLTYLASIVYCFFKKRSYSFWLLFILIALSPMLTPLGISWIVAERYVYFGIIGIIILVSLLIDRANQIKQIRNIPLVLTSIVVLALSARTILRNNDWQNQDNLWLSAARYSPSSHQNHNNLGDYYARQGELDKAIEEFQRAINLKPDYADAYHNMANIYWQKNDLDKAIELYKKAAEISPILWQSRQNLAAIHFQIEEYGKAREYLEEAIKIQPNNPSFYANLGIIYLSLNNQQKAQENFQKAVQLDPNNSEYQKFLEQTKL